MAFFLTENSVLDLYFTIDEKGSTSLENCRFQMEMDLEVTTTDIIGCNISIF